MSLASLHPMGTFVPFTTAIGIALAVTCAGSAHAQRAALPDLVIEDLKLSHDEAAPDTVVGVKFRVKNVGATAAQPFRISVYHSEGLVVPARGNVTRIGATRAYLGVPAGGVESFELDVRLPPCEGCKPGNIYAYADAWGTVPELSEVNNYKAVPIRIDNKFKPNLVLDQMKVSPDRGALDRTLTVSARLRNVSSYIVYGPVKIGVYCSKDYEIDAADTLVTAFTETRLAPLSSVNITKPLTLSPSCPIHGQHAQIGMLADIDDAVSESDEDDNGALVPYWVLKAPDLVPGQVAVAPGAGPPGTPVLVRFTAENRGKLPATGVEVGIYLGKSARVTTKDTKLGSQTIASLPPGSTTMTLGDKLVIPKLPHGKYYLGVIVDEAGQAGELREYNNVKSVPFSITHVNLTDRHFFVDRSKARPGDEVQVRFALRNLGSDTAGAFSVGVYYSDDPRYDPSDEKLGSVSLSRLPKGEDRTEHTLSLKLPKNAPAGYRYLLLITDDGGEVLETDEVDNIAMRPVLIERK